MADSRSKQAATSDPSAAPGPSVPATPPTSSGGGADGVGAGTGGGGLAKQYRPAEAEPRVRARWRASGAFHADPGSVLREDDSKKKPYAVLIPPPNVTAELHLGHALNNTIQDILVRAHRMMGFEALWMPGTDHAGIATQTVVERRVLKDEGKRRTDFPREEFVAKIQAFKDEYEKRITEQLIAMGCSCDWERQRFTMDPQCAAGVREAFFRLFRDGLIYRGKRLVNWDPVTQTALADDEVEMEEVEGAFYYLRYPLAHPPKTAGDDPQPVTWSELAMRGYPGAGEHPPDGEAWVTVATTRPETYLGDTAVGINPQDPRAKSLRGLLVELPIVGRLIPIIEDDYVVMPAADPDAEGVDTKARYATGFLKVTPAHDENDYLIGQRHGLAMINVFAPDASISDKHGWADVGDAAIFVGKDREQARKEVVHAFSNRGLLESTRPYKHSVGHSYRSHAAIEPYLSDQWYVKVTDEKLAGAALRAMVDGQRSTTDRKKLKNESTTDEGLTFHPSRYAKTYENWHENIRDWCISRQLWWGHRIPVWSLTPRPGYTHNPTADMVAAAILDYFGTTGANVTTTSAQAEEYADFTVHSNEIGWFICARTHEAANTLDDLNQQLQGDSPSGSRLDFPTKGKHLEFLKQRFCGCEQDPDVLDTWFSSALWPLSTMGWPNPDAFPDSKGLLEAFNPTSVLCTAREIITLWVSRMVMFNRYFLAQDAGSEPGTGPVPFRDVFIHAMIQDGEGRKMSKSLGNGVDPLNIIATHGADAMRFTLCHMTTQTQDVRMPVERDAATGKNTSPKFDLGRNFANKLWNAARFALGILGAAPPSPAAADGEGFTPPPPPPSLTDRWMLSRLAAATAEAETALREYQFSQYATVMYDLLWRDFCDWYLEAIKPTVAGEGGATQRAVLRATLDVILRLLHPIMPFVTEAIFEELRKLPAHRVPGVDMATAELLATSSWPQVAGNLRDEEAEARFERVRRLVTAVREVRAQHQVPPKQRITLHAPAQLSSQLGEDAALVATLAGLERITAEDAPPAPRSVSLRLDIHDLALSGLREDVEEGAGKAAELERLGRIIAQCDKTISATQARLDNPGYAQKAPAKLVEETKAQLAKAISEREAAARELERLS